MRAQEAAKSVASVPRAVAPLGVLTITPFHPFAGDDAYGCFVSEPLGEVARFGIASRVIAVEPAYRRARSPASPDADVIWLRYPRVPGNLGLATAGIFLTLRLIRRARRLVARGAVSLIHAHGALPCGHAAVLLSRAFGIPFVVTVHGLDAFSTRQVSGPAGRWCEAASRHVYREARRVLCVSRRVCLEVERGMRSASAATAVVYNSVDEERFRPGERDPAPSILSVGNLIPIKGHETVLRSLPLLANAHPTLLWEVIGDGPEKRRLSALADTLGLSRRVRFRGRCARDEVAAAMRRCSAFVLPSRYEALGCVYLEAMASARPVIACSGQGIGEVIRDGDNGLLVEPDDPAGLARSLARVLEDEALRRRLGERARQTVLERFTVGHQARRLARIYRECLGEAATADPD